MGGPSVVRPPVRPHRVCALQATSHLKVEKEYGCKCRERGPDLQRQHLQRLFWNQR